MTIFEYLFLFFSVFLGGIVAFYLKKNNKTILQLVLSFSGAYLIGITFLHLMPGVFSSGSHETGFWVLGGFFLQLILEQLSRGVEHGHLHAPHQASPSFAFMVMTGLCVHAFLEGMPMSHYSSFLEGHGHDHGHNHLLYGIILHKVPAAFALVLLLLLSGYRKGVIWVCLGIFALMSPLGAWLSQSFSMNRETQEIIMAIVIGSFLHISTTILFESDNTHHHRIPWKKMLAIVVGLGLGALTAL